jgi:hypothetical protein
VKENKYDEQGLFDHYSKMSRSILGLPGAGEWHRFEKLLPGHDIGHHHRLTTMGCSLAGGVFRS